MSSRIPDSVHYNGRFRVNAQDKCKMFNSFFCAQFSEASRYNIEINQLSNSIYDIDFSPTEVYKILRNVDPSKASGPDGIDGFVLKACSSSLSIPLSIIFNQCYNTGKYTSRVEKC